MTVAQLSLPVQPVADPDWARDRLAEIRAEIRAEMQAKIDGPVLEMIEWGEISGVETWEIADTLIGLGIVEPRGGFRRTASHLASMERRGLVWHARERRVVYGRQVHQVTWLT